MFLTKRKILIIARTITDLESLEHSNRDSSDEETPDEKIIRQTERIERNYCRIQNLEEKVLHLWRKKEKLDHDIELRRLWREEAHNYIDSLSIKLKSLLE